MNRKGFCAPCFLVPLLVIIAIVIILGFGWMGSFNFKECKKNSECGSGSYCGSDFQCHEHPVIKETQIITKENNVFGSFLLALGLIGFAAMLKFEALRDYFQGRKKESGNGQGNGQEAQAPVQPYYEAVSESYTSGEHSYRLEDPSGKKKAS